MSQYLYRNSARVAIAGVFLLGVVSQAQIRDRTQHQDQQPANQTPSRPKNTKRGPRAIAVVEFLPGGAARLVPIALWIDDRYYDASLYGANPEPMALEPQTVYEATDYGEPAGLFTVTGPKQVNGNWVADGHWKPHLAMDEKLAQQAAKQPKPKAPSHPDDERPILRRGASDSSSPGGSGGSSSPAAAQGSASASSGSSASTANTPPPSDDDPDRPTLKKPVPETPPPSSSSPSGSQAAASGPATSSSANDESDPNRPVLRRGAAAAQASTTSTTPAPKKGTTTAAKTGKPVAAPDTAEAKPVTKVSQPGHRSYPAVSDAGKYETRSLLYAMNSEERASKSQQMIALALEDIRKFVAGRTSPALPKNANITDYDLRAFDLDFSNSPTLVLTAELPVENAKALRGGPFQYFVTVVAREDINGTPIKIFSSVSDSNHLDAYSRMEIIDAVDADANGRGDLLFRRYSDVGVSYALYRIYPYEMRKLFEGGSGM